MIPHSETSDEAPLVDPSVSSITTISPPHVWKSVSKTSSLPFRVTIFTSGRGGLTAATVCIARQPHDPAQPRGDAPVPEMLDLFPAERIKLRGPRATPVQRPITVNDQEVSIDS